MLLTSKLISEWSVRRKSFFNFKTHVIACGKILPGVTEKMAAVTDHRLIALAYKLKFYKRRN